ncbi:cation:proton antiporter [Legionella londiniensis]|uniref:Sodium/hydrogen exchanger n=1 Tax=Legionella londiniensis TaxID=45068 RepID=A0A0W0VIA3_9GAMM|nr:cation:proton antiporter [Legionella londiniensis]KTD19574.1 sodium/hydrogen exchanger [Legionella londiniensis]STX92203.1 sodium/hydrogen exchanger [Legionella londiniensis]
MSTLPNQIRYKKLTAGKCSLAPHILPPVVELVTATVILITIAAIVKSISTRLNWPFTIVLVAVGLALGHLQRFGAPWLEFVGMYQLRPEFILYICLPTLLFESAYHLDSRQLKRNLFQILLLAIPGVLLSTLLMGLIIAQFTSIGLIIALLLGAILSATDPVAVISLFQSLGAPKRLTVLVEGESLFNDATSLVVAKILLVLAAAGSLGWETISHGILDFVVEFIGGLLFGWAFAYLVGMLLGRLRSLPQIEISLTTILAYASFIIAEQILHLSGVLAVVAAGLTMGNWGQAKISPQVGRYLENFWGFAAYLVNAIIFLLVGLSIDLSRPLLILAELGVVILAMLISRAVVIYGLIPLSRHLPLSAAVNWRYQTVMFWGGLRGAVSLAIVLGLTNIPEQPLLIDLVAGAVLFTLFVQGLSIERLIQWLGLTKIPLVDQLMKLDAQIITQKEAIKRLAQLKKEGLLSTRLANEFMHRNITELKSTEQALLELQRQKLDRKKQEQFILSHLIVAEIKALHHWFALSFISENAYRNLLDTLRTQLDAIRYGGDLGAVSKILKAPSWREKFVIRFIEPHSFAQKLAAHLRANRIAREYQEIWALFEGTKVMLNYLREMETNFKFDVELVKEMQAQIATWQHATRQQLEQMAGDFPDIILGLQQQLNERVVLQSEIEIIKEEARAGRLPEGVAKEIIRQKEEQLDAIQQRPVPRLNLDPHELLHHVYLFKSLSKEEFDVIFHKFRSYAVPIGHEIITQGASGSSMFFIARGIVRVFVEEDSKIRQLATLMAGDFIGEMAMLTGGKRSATCRAATPCVIYELKQTDYQAITEKYPHISAKIIQTAEKRRAEMG